MPPPFGIGHDLVEHADFLERAQRRAVEGEAGAEHAPILLDFDQIDGDADSLQADCRAHAAETAADDEDFLHLAQKSFSLDPVSTGGRPDAPRRDVVSFRPRRRSALAPSAGDGA